MVVRAADRRALLAATPLFQDLDPKQLDEIARVAHSKQLVRHEELFHKGDEGAEIFVVVEGKLKVLTTSIHGDEIVFSILGRGDVFGEIALFAGTPRTATIVAIEACDLLAVHRRDLFALLTAYPKSALSLLRVLAARLIRLSELVEDTQFLSLTSRLAKTLSALATDYGEQTDAGMRVDLRLSQGEWGNLLGVTRESINKQIRIWTTQGILSADHGYIVIHRPDELEKIAGEHLF
jgi:CRP-like cAMP-binding protein